MSTQAAALLGGSIIVAAVIVAVAFGGQDEVVRDTGTISAAPPTGGITGTTSADAGATPSLEGESTDQRLARLQRELDTARDQIEKMKATGAPRDAATPAAGPTSRTPEAHKAMAERFFELGKAYSAGEATKAEVGELLRLTGDKALMQGVVADLEARIAENPDDLDARLQLVDVQSARAHTAESIVERGMLGDSVRTQLGEVLKRDPENWEARYMQAVGISHSQRTPQGRARAIQAFESLIALQQQKAAEPRFAKTYGQLAGVLMAEKNAAKARETLTEGLRRFPDDEALKKMLDGLPADGG
ncbi:MAG: hypothetical protein QNJ98_08725 [Planctomycetota bacterium]|nr:hypothetical protein [Planctomycetota bacterium]